MHRNTPNRCKIRLREVQRIAREHGGKCISDAYITRQTPMAFVCRLGHVWKARPANVLTGHWCPNCAHVPEDGLTAVKALARERGGQCLSTRYVVKPPGMRWRCAEGHEWSAPPSRIRIGTWCPGCAGHRTIDDWRALAAQHGGRCLATSTEDGAYDSKVQWECAQGHIFAVRWRCVRDGQWCPECRQADGTWQQALARAASLGGVCLAAGRQSTNASIEWRCAQGHVFSTSAYRLRLGAWCPRCSGRRLAIEDMQALATERGGRCISRRFVNSQTALRWQCAAGHRWSATSSAVRNQKTWCPQCEPDKARRSPPRRGSILWEKALARCAATGDVCIGGRDLPPSRSTSWRCPAGHVWTASAYRMANGATCPRCSGRRLGIEHMHTMAAERGGRCISEKFVDAYTKLQWECERGHRWWAKPTVVRCAGTWCPHCAWDANADRMRSEAKDLA